MVEGEEALTLWDLYESNREHFGGIIIDERPGADNLILLLDMDDANRKRYLETLPEEFVDGLTYLCCPGRQMNSLRQR